MERGEQSPAGGQPVDARGASSGNLNSNPHIRNGVEDGAFSSSAPTAVPARSPSGPAIPSLALGLGGRLVAVKSEIDTDRPRVSDEALLWEGAAASAPSGDIDVGHACDTGVVESEADDKSLIRRLASADTWSRSPTNRTVSEGTARTPISQTRISCDGLPLVQIAAAQSQDAPAGQRTVHDGALPGHVGEMRDNRASSVLAAKMGMVAEMSIGDSSGARRGTPETAKDRDAQRAPTFAQGAGRAVDHSVSNHCAESSDRVSALNYPGTESVLEHITVCSNDIGIGSLNHITLPARAHSRTDVGGLSLPIATAEQHDRVGARLGSVPGLSDNIRHAGAGRNNSVSPRLGTSSDFGLNAGGSDRLEAGIATAPRPGATGLRLAQGNHAQGVGQDDGGGSHKASTDRATSRDDSVSGLPPASNFPRRSNQAPALLAGQNADVSAASGLAVESGSGVASHQTTQSGPATPRPVAALSHIGPQDFVAGTSLPADDIRAHDSLESLRKTRYSATENTVGGSGSAASVETTRTASLPSAIESGQASIRQDAMRLASAEEHAISDSAGDTVDIALAALSYADAAASASASPGADYNGATAVGFDNGSAGQDRQFCSRSACGELARGDLPPGEREHVEGTAPTAAPLAAGASTHPEQSSLDALGSLDCAPMVAPLPLGATQAGSNGSATPTISRREKGARARDRRDDMMHAMCMICLDKFSDPADGGGAKVLGLLDSCSHRYCYQCILEWSKITNKCPQCKSRFHTIKAVKELRRNNNRYRGVAVNVEDRDQTYSSVDVRDVVVLDPDVGCHPGCLLRSAVDAFQQPGWEFSVQCEQCSGWFHGTCVGFHEETAVPDRWFCNPCIGQAHLTAPNPAPVSAPAARATASSRGRGSSGRNRGRGRGHGRGQPTGRLDRAPPLASAQVQERGAARGRCQVPGEDDSDIGSRSSSRIAVDGTQATEEADAPLSGAPQQASASPTPPAPPVQAQSTSSPSPTVAAASARGRGRARGSAAQTPAPQQTPPSPVSPAPPVQVQSASSPSPAVAAPPPRGSGRTHGSVVEAAISHSAPPQQASGRPAPPVPPVQVRSAPSPSPQVATVPRGRSRPRGSRTASPSAKPSAPLVSEPPVSAPPVSASAPTQATAAPASPTSVPPSVPPPDRTQEPQQQPPPPPIADQPHTGGSARGSATPPCHAHSDDAVSSSPDVPAVLPERPPPSLLRTLEASEMSELCDVCGFDTEPDNLIVYCESCNMGVHQTCYGISQIPTKEWYCSPCSSGVHPSTLACRFCPIKGGALKRCTDGKWGHILCAFWIPECCFIDPRKMEPIGSINKRGQAGGVEKFLPTFRARKCYICGTSTGSAIRCHTPSCKFHLHPMCGSRAGSVYMEIETTMKTGADGTEHEAVKLVAKCPRHNKNKPAVSRSRKGREAMASAADPLRIANKTIEIADPGQDGAVVLTGKVTWFDQDRSRYCIMTSFSGVGGEGNGGGSSSGDGGSCSGGLEATGGCAHWITAEKLVGAKAVRVDLKSGKRFAVEPPPSVEGGEEETDSESESQGDRIKIEENDNEGERAGVDREESGASPTEEGHKGKMNDTAGDEEQKRDSPGSVLENEPDEAELLAVARGKHGRGAMVSPPSSPSAAPTKRAARAGMRTRRELDLERTQETEGAAEIPPCTTSRDQSSASVQHDEDTSRDEDGACDGSEARDGDEAASENRDTASSAESRNRTPIAQQQRRRLLPSVQVPAPPQADPFSRYPIRGRLKRPLQPAEFQESNGVEGVPSAKKRRAGEDEVEELVIPATAGSNPTSNEEVESPDEVPAADDYVRRAPMPPEMNECVPFGPTLQSRFSTDVPTASDNASRNQVVQPLPEQASCTAYVVEPGWPNGRDTPGQIPVMRVRTIRLTGGKEAMFFASAHTGVAASVSCGSRSTSRFFFPFERFEEVEAACAHEELPREGEGTDESLVVRSQHPCEPVETQEAGGAGDIQQDVEAKVEAAKEDVHRVGEVRNPPSSGAKENRGEGSDGDEGLEGDKTGSEVQAAELPKDTMPPSPPQGGDTSEMEDGEIETGPDGRADIMPPSPRDEEMESVADVIGHGTEDVLEVEVAEGSNSPPKSVENQTVGRDSDGTDVVQTRVNMLWSQDMAISSDEQSCGEPEGVETSSYCSFEDVLRRAEDTSPSDEASATTNIGDHACDPTGAAGSIVTACSPATAESTEAPQEHLPGGPLSSRPAEPTVSVLSDDERTGVESTEAETTTAGQAPEGLREASTPPSSPDPQQQAATIALRTIVREQLQGILKSASKGGEAALASGNGAEVFERIAVETEEELFGRIYNHSTGGREYKAKYKQLLLSVGNVRNYRLVASVLEGNTTPTDLATKDAVGLLKSLSSSLNCLAIPLAGRNRQSARGRSQRGRSSRRGKMRLLG